MTEETTKRNSEIFIMMDDQSWIWSFTKKVMNSLSVEYVRLPSDTPLRQSWSRFKDAPRLVLYWENKGRSGGALVEEILDVDPYYDISENLIVFTTNPTREDVVYFAELGIKRVIRLRNRPRELEIAGDEFLSHLKTGIDKTKASSLWRRIIKDVNKVVWKTSPENIKLLNERFQKLIQATGEKDSSRALDVAASLKALNGDAEEAKELWEKALEVNPNYFRSYQMLTRFLRHQGDLKSAFVIMQKMQQMNKSNISRLVEMGEIQVEMDDDHRAEHYFQSALERDSYCTGALNGMAEIRFRQGDLDESRHLLSKSQKAEQIASKLNKIGIQLVKEKDYASALEHYTKAQYVLPLQEKGPMLFYNIGLCYSRWGKYDMAKEFLQIALIKEPTYEKAKRLLSQIENSSDE